MIVFKEWTVRRTLGLTKIDEAERYAGLVFWLFIFFVFIIITAKVVWLLVIVLASLIPIIKLDSHVHSYINIR